MAHHVEQLRHGSFECLGHIRTLQHLLDLFTVLGNPFLDELGEVARVGLLLHILRDELTEFTDLSNHGRDDQVDDQGYHGNHDDHGDDDAQGACGHMAFLLHELHDGVEEVGQQPCYEEGQQYFTEVVHGEQYTEYQQGNACPAYESVECDFFVHCNLLFFLCKETNCFPLFLWRREKRQKRHPP